MLMYKRAWIPNLFKLVISKMMVLLVLVCMTTPVFAGSADSGAAKDGSGTVNTAIKEAGDSTKDRTDAESHLTQQAQDLDKSISDLQTAASNNASTYSNFQNCYAVVF